MLTLAETCAYLRMSPKTVRKAIAAGDLEASRVGRAGIGGNGAYRITEEAIAAYLERRRAVPAEAAS